MGRTTESVQEALEILDSIFPNMPRPRREKCRSLWNLARGACHCIVELGTAEGNGAIALALGSSVPVYTIDDYDFRTGWASEQYGEFYLEKFNRNVQKAGVDITLIRESVYDVVWDRRIGLLHWDLGVMGSMVEDFRAWRPWCDVMAFHDTYDQKLGSKKIGLTEVLPGGIWVYRRYSAVE